MVTACEFIEALALSLKGMLLGADRTGPRWSIARDVLGWLP